MCLTCVGVRELPLIFGVRRLVLGLWRFGDNFAFRVNEQDDESFLCRLSQSVDEGLVCLITPPARNKFPSKLLISRGLLLTAKQDVKPIPEFNLILQCLATSFDVNGNLFHGLPPSSPMRQ